MKPREAQKISSQRLAIIAGLYICLAMIIYFMLMKYLGLAHMAELRFLNFVISGAGAAATIKYYNKKTQSRIHYLEGLNLSFTAFLSASIFFAIFIFLYFSFVNPELLEVIRVDAPVMGKYLSPLTAGISVIAEGVVAGLALSFSLMQYFKDDQLHDPYKQRGHKTEAQAPERE